MEDRIYINEVAPRDGLQNQPVLVSLEGKLALIQSLCAAGVRSIEATSFVSPKAVPQLADAAELFARLDQTHGVAYSALVPNQKGLERAHQAGAREIAVVLSATETMNLRNINMSLTQALTVCQETIGLAKALGKRTKAYLAVAFECPFEGVVDSATVIRLAEALHSAGADEIVIADTIGAAGPTGVRALLTPLLANYGRTALSVHFHDTRGMAVANAWAALECGLRKFDSSVGGLGGCPFAPGAAGNLATEDLVLLAEQSGLVSGIDLVKLLDTVVLAESLVQRPLGGRSYRWLTSGKYKPASMR
ncbi:hydroxymethylglutaryl-CoA lyase [Denitratisoma oestradiolicum]|uniref:Hydroxymethylglutaryl-CoA lyase YngG n=1 Tax=Denitratisoma oestradiolicum TaxID=311182 RepID=A0A6S6XUB3_9PROT|nr:hydroxymethylglutaryl-CoA lyase [Denitratisoma oestradiolicum]TWO79847.1 hydroxymethylglutaryl-CoA lyase [Denitratisoma oestradiolicum]CAB1369545.1 Hydroxymethylglutaryl-CoA lyase YngG [Denitratisoma oestradiolicum]